jgi:hypothetical protein
MNASKTFYDDIPETIRIPEEFIHKKGEIIIIIDEKTTRGKKKPLKEYFGILSDFPEREKQGEYEPRDVL